MGNFKRLDAPVLLTPDQMRQFKRRMQSEGISEVGLVNLAIASYLSLKDEIHPLPDEDDQTRAEMYKIVDAIDPEVLASSAATPIGLYE